MHRVLILQSVLALLLAAQAHAGPYVLRDLGAFRQDPQARAGAGINDAGQVTGITLALHAFLYNQAGGMQDLGTLGGGTYSLGEAINYNIDKVQIVGVADAPDGANHAIRWDSQSQTMQDLGTGEATDINKAGYAVGYTSSSPCSLEAVMWDPVGNAQGLGCFLYDASGTVPVAGPFSWASGINNVGQVVGWTAIVPDASSSNATAISGFIWDASGGMRSLPLGQYAAAYAYRINDVGQIVGYASRIDAQTGQSFTRAVLWAPGDTGYVIQDLGTLGGANAQAIDINDSGQVVGWAEAADGSQQGFIWDAAGGMRLLPVPDTMSFAWAGSINKDGEIAGAVLDTNYNYHGLVWRPDADGDGLLDVWEERGYDSQHDGVIDLDLPGMGADKNHKDVFVHVDYMVASDHTHRPTAQAVQTLINAFNNAPVSNPDGTTGINLHIDAGPDVPTNKHILTHTDVLGSQNSDGTYNWGDFQAIKAGNFPPERLPIFHYVIFAHDIIFPGTRMGGISRTAKGDERTNLNGGSDLIVSLGEFSGNVGTDSDQAITLMHELGHNFHRLHGGSDIFENKPNYLSVMNRLFWFTGLRINGAFGTFDYSRFTFPDLDETNLNEPVGLSGPSSADSYGTAWYCPGGQFNITDSVNSAMDWNCNFVIDTTPVAVDVNNDTNFTTLRADSVDWDNLLYWGGSIGSQSATFSTELSPN